MGEANGLRNYADGSTVPRGMQRTAADTKTAENTSRKVSSQSNLRTRNSPPRLKTEMPEHPR